MEIVMAISIGGIYAMAVYLMLRRSLVKVILGVMLFGQGVNLLIFASAGMTRDHAAVIPGNAETVIGPSADPLPQALVLTAIVIGFGVVAFTLALVHKTQQALQMDDVDKMKENDG